jgi:cold shock CspA family protein
MAKGKGKNKMGFYTGTIVWYSRNKKHGQIRSDSGNKVTFFTSSELRCWKDEPQKGDKVEYKLDGRRSSGNQAIQISLEGSNFWSEAVVKWYDRAKGRGRVQLFDASEHYFYPEVLRSSKLSPGDISKDCMVSVKIVPSSNPNFDREVSHMSLV